MRSVGDQHLTVLVLSMETLMVGDSEQVETIYTTTWLGVHSALSNAGRRQKDINPPLCLTVLEVKCHQFTGTE